jgi:diguanylate cyclase (GGDEF)-like protein
MYGRQLINVPCPHDGSGGAHPSICVPLLAQGETLGMLNVAFPDAPVGKQTGSSDEGDLDERRQLVLMASEQIGLAIANVRLRDELRTQSVRDVLTGLANRRAFLTALREALGAAAHNGSSMALLSVDVDHFKSINDTHGHAVGDAVLNAMVERLSAEIRPGDAIARFGGEEFLVLMPRITPVDALAVAERMRKALLGTPVEAAGRKVPVTASFGVALEATLPHADAMPDLLDRADSALYLAKRNGRNRVVAAEGMVAAA